MNSGASRQWNCPQLHMHAYNAIALIHDSGSKLTMRNSDPPTPTRQLLAELDRGDQGSARELFGRYRPDLLARAARHPWMRAVRGHTSHEDVVQEVFSRAIASGLFSVREDRAPGSLRGALHVVLERVLADQLRHLGAAKNGAAVDIQSLDAGAEETGNPLLGQLAGSSTTPTVSARSAELIRLCQANLEDHEWEVWRLRVVAGLDFDDVAKLSGCTAASARGVMHRARKKLILSLAELDPECPPA